MSRWALPLAAICAMATLDLTAYYTTGKIVAITAVHGATAVTSYMMYVLLKVGRTGELNQIRLGIQPSTSSENTVRLFALANFAFAIVLGVIQNRA